MKPLEINYGTQAQIAAYSGVSGYLAQPVWATDEHRLYVFNGSTTGGYAVAMKADLNAYLTTSAASTTYLGINAKAKSAGTADSATKATQDANGATIHTTYGTKTEVGQRILAAGDRGTLAGYETLSSSSSAVTISDSSPDDTATTGAAAITVNNGTGGKVWTKTVGIDNEGATITLGSSWKWQGGKAPTVAAYSILVLKWYGTWGYASLALTS